MIPYFDAHCDTVVANKSIEENGGHLDLRRLGEFSPCAQIFAVCCPEDMPGGYERYLPELRRQIESSPRALLCLNVQDIKKSADQGKIGAIMAVEGAEHFGCSIKGLEAAYEMGVRSVNITWNFDNALSGAAMASGAGLTGPGRRFVAAAQDMGVIIDVSHLSEKGFWDVLEIAKRPVYASHSDSLAQCGDYPRNLTDSQFSALVKCGGGTGINLCPDFLGHGRDMDAVIRHLEHFLALGGERSVFLGTDFDGIDETPAGISSVADMPKLYEALLRRNYKEELVKDIFWNNLLGILESAL